MKLTLKHALAAIILALSLSAAWCWCRPYHSIPCLAVSIAASILKQKLKVLARILEKLLRWLAVAVVAINTIRECQYVNRSFPC